MPRGPDQTRTGAHAGASLWLFALCALIPIVCLAIPIYVIRPFTPQDPRQLAIALAIRNAGPWVSAVCAVVVICALFLVWKRSIGLFSRIVIVALSVITLACAALTHVNIFEIMFHPYPDPDFEDAKSAPVDVTDMVLAVKIGVVAHAYPIRTLGYHHIVNDSIGGVPFAVTYCTLCHSGVVWSRVLDGRTLRFRLAGINNGNALMRDEQTNSIWQQSTGQAIFGAMKGRQLDLIRSDEMTFGLWRSEQPQGLVLKPDAPYADEYDPKNWESQVERTPVVIDTSKSGIRPHELMLGVTLAGQSKAYPIKTILAAKLIQDQLAGGPLLIVVGPDRASIRVFQWQGTAESKTFVPLQTTDPQAKDGSFQDAETGSAWSFQGCAISGKLAGQCLTQVDVNKDYWFDWMNHHPSTQVFRN